MSISLDKIVFFRNNQNVAKLERLIFVSNRLLMPHQVATSLGLTVDESMQLLLYIFHLGYAELFLLVYHVDHLHEPSDSLSIFDGFPNLPFHCSICEKEVKSYDELEFDFLFKFSENIEFTSGHK